MIAYSAQDGLHALGLFDAVCVKPCPPELMPLGLTASFVLAKAVALAERAKRLADSATSAPLKTEIGAIELDASNIRMLLTDTLRGAYGGQPPLEGFSRRLEESAARLGDLENRT